MGLTLGQDRPAGYALENLVTIRCHSPKDGLFTQELLSHCPSLRSHPREHKDRFRLVAWDPPGGRYTLATAAVEIRPDLFDDVLERLGGDGQAVVEVSTPHGRGVTEIGQAWRIRTSEPGQIALRQVLKRLLVASRDRQEAGAPKTRPLGRW